MPKYDLETIANLQNESTVVATINANNVLIEAALDAALFRTGTGSESDNAMIVDLDMNSKRILNLPAPSDPLEAARHGDLQTYVDDAVAAQEAAETAQANAEAQVALAAAEVVLAQAQVALATAQVALAVTARTGAETAETNAEAVLTEIETHSINSGVSTPVAVGTKSSGTYTPEPADGALLTGTNGGAFTLAAPTGTGWYRLVLINNASAGIISTSGWDITLDSDTSLEHVVENSVIEYMAVNDGFKKVLQVKLLLDATP